MDFRELTTGAYAKLHDMLPSDEAFALVPLLSFDYPSKSNDFIYSQQEADFTRELVNSFNQFAYWLGRIALWEKLLLSYDENDAEELRFEFTKLQLDYCLHFPYQFKSKLAFCATQLCYTRGVAQRLLSRADVMPDEKINVRTLSLAAMPWGAGPALVAALQEVDSSEYREKTLNYRNKAQHRHGPRLDFGHIANIVRDFPEGSLVSYSFGELPPIMTANALPVLGHEGTRLRSAFEAYRALVDEHWHGADET